MMQKDLLHLIKTSICETVKYLQCIYQYGLQAKKKQSRVKMLIIQLRSTMIFSLKHQATLYCLCNAVSNYLKIMTNCKLKNCELLILSQMQVILIFSVLSVQWDTLQQCLRPHLTAQHQQENTAWTTRGRSQAPYILTV